MSEETAPLRQKPGKKGLAPKIRKLHLRHPELTPSEIARRVGCSANNASGVLRTFLGKTSVDSLRDFQESKADVYDSIQVRLLSSISTKKLTKARVQELVTSAAILEDKARVIRGQATGINVNVLLDIAQAMRDRRDNPPAVQAPVIDAK